MSENKWCNKNYSITELNELINQYGLTRPIALSLVTKGINSKNIDYYFNATLKDLSSPYRIPGIEKAAKRLWDAIIKHEHILIHGDFDVDGITASTLIVWLLKEFGANVSVFIPHRLDTGYGFTPESLKNALELHKCNVLITVDCGITSNEAVDLANSLGIDVIITDHHEQGSSLPNAYALINTKIYPELADLHSLAGVGTTFKLAHGFLKYGTENGLLYKRIELRDILDLVALGTVADIVPLLGENRILTKYGLKVLSQQTRPGIRALCEVSGIKGNLRAEDIAFKLAPHINAAGRVGDPHIAFDLLNTTNIIESSSFSKLLKQYNIERRSKEQEIFAEAESQIYETINKEDAFSLIIYGNNWHQGVIGNVASRIAREYNRPSIILTIIDNCAYGSGRSPTKVNLVNLLTEYNDILIRYGGHPMAIGLSLKEENIKELKKRFEESIRKVITKDDLIPQIDYDGEICIAELTDAFFNELQKLEPFVHSNPNPLYKLSNVTTSYISNCGEKHTKGYLKDSSGKTIAFVAFNMAINTLPPQPWNILATPQLNNFHGTNQAQLRIIDIKSIY